MLDVIFSENEPFRNLCVLIDSEHIIPPSEVSQNETSDKMIILHTTDPVELRTFHETYIRDKTTEDIPHPYIIVFKRQNPLIPYDFEKKHYIKTVSLQELFPFLDTDIIRGLSSSSYQKLKQTVPSGHTGTYSREETGDLVFRILYGSDPSLIWETEQLIALIIDIHLSDEELTPALLQHLNNRIHGSLIPTAELKELLTKKEAFFQWISKNLDEFIHSRFDKANESHINFSHPSLAMKIFHLISQGFVTKPELPDTIHESDLTDEDRWLLLLSPPVEIAEQPLESYADPDIQAQITNLKDIASVDQESFLVKTRKIMETVVKDRLSYLSVDTYLPSLFDKLKYLEEHNYIPKTTATFFHTIRKLGNLGAHESNSILLTDAEVETILAMLSYILRWHKEN